MKRSFVPRYLTLKDEAERTDAWLLWRLRLAPEGLTETQLIRDGSYDLYHLQSNSDKTRKSLFKKSFKVRRIHLEDRNQIRLQGNRYFAVAV